MRPLETSLVMGVEKRGTYQGTALKKKTSATTVARRVTCREIAQRATVEAVVDLKSLATSAARKATSNGTVQKMAQGILLEDAIAVTNQVTLPETAKMTALWIPYATAVTKGVTLPASVQALIRRVTTVERLAT